MKGFLAPLQGLAEYEQICEKSKKNKGILQVSGCLESQKAHLIYGLGQTVSRRLIHSFRQNKYRHIHLGRSTSQQHSCLFLSLACRLFGFLYVKRS